MTDENQGVDMDIPPAKKLKVDSPEDRTELNIKNETDLNFSDDVTVSGEKDFSVGGDNYNFVAPEELAKLREFQVLDEVKSNDEDSDGGDSHSSDGPSEGLPEEEIEKMLDENLPDDFKGAPKPKPKPYVTRQKVVLEEKGINHFEVLPLDWIVIRHHSGIPVYMHRTTRVCTLSKPYFIGKGNTKRHDIPISAIPCLAYKRALEEEEKQNEIDRKIEEQINGARSKNINQTNTECNNVVNKEKAFLRIINQQGSFDQHNKVKRKCPVAKGGGVSFLENASNEDANAKLTEVESSVVSENDAGNKQNPQDIVSEPESLDIHKENKSDTIENQRECSGGNLDEIVQEDKQEEQSENNEIEIPLNRRPVVLPDGAVMPPPRVESVKTSWKTQHLSHEQVNDYCKKLFKFKTITLMHFERWADRRKYNKARKTFQYPTLPEGTKLITIPAPPSTGADNGTGNRNKRDWMMNMNDRSYLSVFHEYVYRALQQQPVYEFKHLENASQPYQATVYIGGMQYGVGLGSSKRQAKSAAARASIHILIPEMRDELKEPSGRATGTDNDADFTFFDYVNIEDPRVMEFCAATCEPSPHAILRTCLLRNFGASDQHIHTEMKKPEYQKIELTMKVGKHTATVVCQNKKTAKQRASQAILQALHPHIRSWGSLLRLYGSRSVKSCKEKKMEEQQITLLQDKARQNEPNHAVLEKLRHEMRKLRERDAAVVPIGTLLLRDERDLPTHSGSNLNNVDF